MNGLTILLGALCVAAIALAVFLIVTLWKLTEIVRSTAARLEETLGQLSMTAEEIRKTAATVRGVVEHTERAAANVEHVTEGVRGFRRTLDAATGILDHAVVPVLAQAAGLVAGAKAAVAHIVNRSGGKEEAHE